ncbi:MAG: phosphoribosylformylglycinamidine synthase, partial [Tissierellia bacterium]|nr:phosphoribosylformylglycinamidine synthase [Tissierellia bacterium]
MENTKIFVEKKAEYSVESRLLEKEIRDYLGINSLGKVRVLNVYEILGCHSEVELKELIDILADGNLDNIYYDNISMEKEDKYFQVELIPGQFNQREDSANEAIKIIFGREDIKVKHWKLLIFSGIEDKDLELIRRYYINPVEMRLYNEQLDARGTVTGACHPGHSEGSIKGFIYMTELEINEMKEKQGLGLDLEDLLFCQKYFKNEEKRDPSIAELKLIDTYWSDHCRHTTFMTELEEIEFEEGFYRPIIEKAFKEYLASRDYVYGNTERPISLMNLATINMKEIKKKGLLNDLEESEEINACSIEIDVDVDGEMEKWLLMFKNETHNHPTEIEPHGGAATCLGGCIRDPLSGRAYVYQAMRITGASDSTEDFEKTLEGKLPQRTISQRAMEGYSSYGNQIGVSSGYIREIYHPNYVAKRMEVGALVAAAPRENVIRETAIPGDLILLIGGRTGKDGLGGAVGSSKGHTEESLETGGAEVQKGNPPLERKILRLFRNENVSKMIKKCNDFGAGGVSVAIGELADGLYINLDKVPLKYPGLDGTEIALSESQERMAVVIDKKDLDKFMAYAYGEDVECTVVA